MRCAPPQLRAQTSPRATGRLGAFSTSIALVLALALVIPSSAAAAEPPATAGWHGRAIERPERQREVSLEAPASFPAGWSAGAVHLGTGLHNPGGSERVREVQKRLWQLGYRPGPVDGIFGPRTLAAAQWFQIKHGFRPTGVVDVAMLALLRERTGATAEAAPTAEPVRGDSPAARSAAPQPQPAAQTAGGRQKPAGDGGSAFARRGLVALALLLLAVPAALALTSLRRRRTPKPRRPAADREVAARPAPQAPGAPSAIGYIRSTSDRAELARHAGAIKRACASRSWKLAELVRDDQQKGAGGTFERPGLAAAMERLSGHGPSRLVVSKLTHLSRSAADLTDLFEWFGEHEVAVIATDVGLDTTTPEGQRAANLILAAYARRQAKTRANGRHGANGHNGNGTRPKAKVGDPG